MDQQYYQLVKSLLNLVDICFDKMRIGFIRGDTWCDPAVPNVWRNQSHIIERSTLPPSLAELSSARMVQSTLYLTHLEIHPNPPICPL